MFDLEGGMFTHVKKFEKRRVGKTDDIGGLEVQSHFD